MTVVIPHGIDGGAWWGSLLNGHAAVGSLPVNDRFEAERIGCSLLLLLQTGHELLAVGRLHPEEKPTLGIVHRGNGVFLANEADVGGKGQQQSVEMCGEFQPHATLHGHLLLPDGFVLHLCHRTKQFFR
ncbi:hypothetical protein SDC9_170169 [bioreactor metagenome]|uniref:Uncharacterized protein n=1 Tax=bioreactor metagenome TaxID=1076179 RepID=A0A645G834_9ZZZZ